MRASVAFVDVDRTAAAAAAAGVAAFGDLGAADADSRDGWDTFPAAADCYRRNWWNCCIAVGGGNSRQAWRRLG